MTKPHGKLILTALFTLTTLLAPLQGGLQAQKSSKKAQATLSGTIRVSSATGDNERKSIYSSYLTGATVSLQTPSDTITVVSNFGRFHFSKVPPGRATLEIKHLGYQTQRSTIDITPGANELRITMQEAVQEIDDIVVQTDILIVTVKGDTLVYNPRAVKTLEGDEAIEVLKNLPGVEIDEDGNISIMGEKVSRSYVDGKLIFGEDPMAVFKNLPASDVDRIRVYDEYTDRNTKAKRRQGDDKQRVINVETKSKLSRFSSLIGSAAAGADLVDSGRGDRARYSGSLSGNYYSEKLNLSVTGIHNNVGLNALFMAGLSDNSPLMGAGKNYSRFSAAGTDGGLAWKNKNDNENRLQFSYEYNDTFTEERSVSHRDFFPTDDYASRTERDTTRTASRDRTHRNYLNLSLMDMLGGKLDLSHQVSFSNLDSESDLSRRSQLDGTPAVTMSRRPSDSKRYDLSERVSWRSNEDRKFYVSIGGNMQLYRSDDHELRYDSVSSTSSRTVLEVNTERPQKSYAGDVGIHLRISEEKKDRISLSYNYQYTDRQSIRAALDVTDYLDPTVDELNTYSYTDRNHRHNVRGGLALFFPKINADLAADLTFSSARVERHERFPRQDRYDSPFRALLPQLSLRIKHNMMSHTSINYSGQNGLPSVEQLRPWLDNTNLMQLTAGNAHLKQNYSHYIHAHHNRLFGTGGNNIAIMAVISYTRNPIISNTRYFTQETILPEWGNYRAPAQSTLLTWENSKDPFDAGLSFSYNRPLKFLKSNLRLGLMGNYADSPSYINGELTDTHTASGSLNVSLRSNFSTTMNFNLISNTSYAHTDNHLGNSRYFSERIFLNWQVRNILKRFFVSGSYDIRIEHRLGNEGANPFQNSLNLEAGLKFNKNRGSLSFQAMNILDSDSGLSTGMAADYVYNSWRHHFGRYFLISLSYKFKQASSDQGRSRHIY